MKTVVNHDFGINKITRLVNELKSTGTSSQLQQELGHLINSVESAMEHYSDQAYLNNSAPTFYEGWNAAVEYFIGISESYQHYVDAGKLRFVGEQPILPLLVTQFYIGPDENHHIIAGLNRKTGVWRLYRLAPGSTQVYSSYDGWLSKGGSYYNNITDALADASAYLNKSIQIDNLVPLSYWSEKYYAYIFTNCLDVRMRWKVERRGKKPVRLNRDSVWVTDNERVGLLFDTAQQALDALGTQK